MPEAEEAGKRFVAVTGRAWADPPHYSRLSMRWQAAPQPNTLIYRRPPPPATHTHTHTHIPFRSIHQPPPPRCAAQRALQIVQKHDEGFGPPSAIAATRLASTLLANGKPQEAQVRHEARGMASRRPCHVAARPLLHSWLAGWLPPPSRRLPLAGWLP
jgi:hypothetical protein